MSLPVPCNAAAQGAVELWAGPGMMLSAFPCCIHLSSLGITPHRSAVGRGGRRDPPRPDQAVAMAVVRAMPSPSPSGCSNNLLITY